MTPNHPLKAPWYAWAVVLGVFVLVLVGGVVYRVNTPNMPLHNGCSCYPGYAGMDAGASLSARTNQDSANP